MSEECCCPDTDRAPDHNWNANGPLQLFTEGALPASAFDGNRYVNRDGKIVKVVLTQHRLPSAAGSLVVNLWRLRAGAYDKVASLSINQNQAGPDAMSVLLTTIPVKKGDRLLASIDAATTLPALPAICEDACLQTFIEAP